MGKRILAALPLAVALLGHGAAMLVIGAWFAVWPASWAGEGFRADLTALSRVAFLLFAGGAGAMLMLMGYGLLRSWPFAWRRFTHAATVVGLAAMGFIGSQRYRWWAWATLIACASSLVLFLRLRREQAVRGERSD